MVGKVIFLVDTNIWLELLLEQEKSEDVKKFLSKADSENLAISEFTIYSIGIILDRLDKMALFSQFLDDVVIGTNIRRIVLAPHELKKLAGNAKIFDLDFDDLYQYISAKELNCRIVSFDSDFDRTEMGRLSPKQAIELL
jgi:predicted nucleic acid-binding protein